MLRQYADIHEILYKLEQNVDGNRAKQCIMDLLLLKFLSEKYENEVDDSWNHVMTQTRMEELNSVIDSSIKKLVHQLKDLKNVFQFDFANSQISYSLLLETVHVIDCFSFKDDKQEDKMSDIFEYIMSHFASQAPSKSGEHYTPKGITELLVYIMNLLHGSIYDPCCGSGAMLIYAANYIVRKKGNLDDILFFGQESSSEAYNLCKINFLIRNIEVDLGARNEDTLKVDQHKDLHFDYILANPPFNQINKDLLIESSDKRWQFGNPLRGNSNFAYLQHCIHHLSQEGILSIIMPTSTLMGYSIADKKIREKLIRADLVESIINLPQKLFYGTKIPSCIWIINKAKERKEKVLFIDADRIPDPNQSTAYRHGLHCEHIKTISKEVCEFRGGRINPAHHYASEATQSEIISKDFCLLPSAYMSSDVLLDHTTIKRNVQIIEQQADIMRESVTQLLNKMKTRL